VSTLKVVAWIGAGIVVVALLAFAGTYVAYFVAAMQGAPKSPLLTSCTQLAVPHGASVLIRFDVANVGRKDATWENYAMFASRPDRGNLSSWQYVLESRIPAAKKVSTVVRVPLPSDYRTLRFAGVQCNIINAVFADGSQQSYGARTDMFP
jgi:hypothetical protein